MLAMDETTINKLNSHEYKSHLEQFDRQSEYLERKHIEQKESASCSPE